MGELKMREKLVNLFVAVFIMACLILLTFWSELDEPTEAIETQKIMQFQPPHCYLQDISRVDKHLNYYRTQVLACPAPVDNVQELH
jgi:hypothetical protein